MKCSLNENCVYINFEKALASVNMAAVWKLENHLTQTYLFHLSNNQTTTQNA